MRGQSIKRYQALLLILLAIFYAQKFASGNMFFYVSPRTGWLALLSIALLIILAGAYRLVEDTSQNFSGNEMRSGPHLLMSMIVFVIPLLLGTVVPPQILGVNAVPTDGIRTELPHAAEISGSVWPDESLQRNVLDWAHMLYENPEPGALDGQEADIVGFVVRDIRLDDNQFFVGRFAITCCRADAQAIGVLVASQDAWQYEDGAWVRVRGEFWQGQMDGHPIPVLNANQIEHVEEPEQPYVFP